MRVCVVQKGSKSSPPTRGSGQTIPWGTIRAAGPSGTRIRYRVRTGRDVTGTPEFPFYVGRVSNVSAGGSMADGFQSSAGWTRRNMPVMSPRVKPFCW